MTTNLLSVIEQLVGALEALHYDIGTINQQHGLSEAALAAGKQALEQTQGEALNEFFHFGPFIDAAGIRADDKAHVVINKLQSAIQQHFSAKAANPQATEPAPSAPAEAHDQTKNLRIQRLGSTFFVAQTETEATMSVRGLSEPAPSTAGERAKVIEDLLMYAGDNGYSHIDYADTMRQAAALLSAPALQAAAMQLADDFAAAAVNHYSAGENDKALWQKMADARQALETKLMEVK